MLVDGCRQGGGQVRSGWWAKSVVRRELLAVVQLLNASTKGQWHTLHAIAGFWQQAHAWPLVLLRGCLRQLLWLCCW
jgi:hypothetical protein